MPADFHIGWWNLENLFDIERSQERPEWLQDRLKSELRGWTATVLNKKLGQLARVIATMNQGAGPDLLGVCEVENRAVLDKLVAKLAAALPGRQYGVAHHDMSDKRGIDVAFLFDTARFEAAEQFDRVIVKRNATRDLFQVNFRTRPAGNTLVMIGNHWPSRRGGQYQSEPYRIIAGETLAYWHERILARLGADTPILAVGDFNDEPFDRALAEYALSERNTRRVNSARSRNPYLLNLMWPLMGTGTGTHYFEQWGVLDQALVNRSLSRGLTPLKLVAGSVEVVREAWMLKGGKPRRFSRPSTRGGIDEAGFSDHLPIGLRIRES